MISPYSVFVKYILPYYSEDSVTRLRFMADQIERRCVFGKFLLYA